MTGPRRLGPGPGRRPGRPADPELAAAVEFTRALTRRRFLRHAGVGAGLAMAAPSVLAACSQSLSDRELTFSNWTAYIDENDAGDNRAKGTTIWEFERQTGIKMNYLTDFNDNDEYFNRSFSPMLGRGKPIAADIVAPTYWMAARIIELGWTEKLDLANIPNHDNLVDTYLGLAWDPKAEHFMPWQAGIAGIAYNKALTGRDLTSANDLYDPAFKGRVTFLSELRDTVGLTLFGLGYDPAEATIDQIHEALDKIQQAVSDGQVSRFTGNEYLQDLDGGTTAACVAWSGDIYSLGNPDISFVVPEEGGTQWFDAMVIPKGAQFKTDAEKWMNFVYDPENAARITEWVGYNSPVKGVKELLLERGGDEAEIAENPLVFPDEETQARLRVFRSLTQDEELDVQTRFNRIKG